MIKTKKIDGETILSILAFLIFPFFSMLYSLLKVKNERNLWVLFFFYLTFGLCFTINPDLGFDSERYVEQFRRLDSDNLRDIYIANIMVDGNVGDVYFPVVAWVTKTVAGTNYHVMFALFALVIAIFTVKTIEIFYKHVHNGQWWMYSLMVFLLIMNNSVFNINGMRFWTAAWMLAYGILSYFVEHRKKGLIWVFITPLVHTTFIFSILLFVIRMFTGRFKRIWTILLWCSVPFSFLSLEFIPVISSYIPDIYMNKFEFYTDNKYIAERASGIGFTYLENFLRTCIMLWEVYCLYRLTKVYGEEDYKYQSLLQLSVVFVTVSNFLSVIPSVGRYIIVGLPLVLFLVWTSTCKYEFRKAFVMLPFLMSFSIADVIINKMSMVLPTDFYYSNLISLISRFL